MRSKSWRPSSGRRKSWNASGRVSRKPVGGNQNSKQDDKKMIQNLTRGLGLLEEAEFAARRDAEQLGGHSRVCGMRWVKPRPLTSKPGPRTISLSN